MVRDSPRKKSSHSQIRPVQFKWIDVITRQHYIHAISCTPHSYSKFTVPTKYIPACDFPLGRVGCCGLRTQKLDAQEHNLLGNWQVLCGQSIYCNVRLNLLRSQYTLGKQLVVLKFFYFNSFFFIIKVCHQLRINHCPHWAMRALFLFRIVHYLFFLYL